jgi:hypothetical protein
MCQLGQFAVALLLLLLSLNSQVLHSWMSYQQTA